MQKKDGWTVYGLMVILIVITSVFAAIAPTAANIAVVTRDLPNSVEVNEQFTVTLTQTGFGLDLGVVWEELPPGFVYVNGSYSGGAPDRVTYNPASRMLKFWFFNEASITYEAKASSYAQTAVFRGTYDAFIYSTINKTYEVETGTVGGDTTVIVGVPTGPEVIPLPGYDNPPTDPDGDGLCEDLNGNGGLDFNDVVQLFKYLEWIEANEPIACFDFNGNGRLDFADIVQLFKEV